MIGSILSASWFQWAVGITIGLPILLIILTEWQHSLRRRGSVLVRPVGVLRNLLLPLRKDCRGLERLLNSEGHRASLVSKT